MAKTTSRRRLFADRAARWLVSAGGIAIIASILGILIFILIEVLPLVFPAKVEPVRKVAIAGPGRISAMLVDEHRTHMATLDDRGRVRVVRLEDGKNNGKVVYSADLLPAASHLRGASVPPESRVFAAATDDGRVLLKRMAFEVTFTGQDRVVTPDGSPPVVLEVDPQHRPLAAFAGQLDEEGGALAAAVLADGKLAVVRRAVEQNEFTGESTETLSRAEAEIPGKVTAMVIDPDQKTLYAGMASGGLLRWPLEDGQPGEPRAVGRRVPGHRAPPAAGRPLAGGGAGERRALRLDPRPAAGRNREA